MIEIALEGEEEEVAAIDVAIGLKTAASSDVILLLSKFSCDPLAKLAARNRKGND